MKWAWINFDEETILFPSKKNGSQPGNIIEPRFTHILKRWKQITAEHNGGDEFVFPASMAQVSGTTKSKRNHVTGKTIAKHLEYIRDTTILPDGGQPQKLSSHKYRHSFAMRALKQSCTLSFIAKVLGDTLATVEQFYSRFLLNDVHRSEHEKMLFTEETEEPWISSEGTAQHPKLRRPLHPLPTAYQMNIAEGFRLFFRNGGKRGNGSGSGRGGSASFGSEGYGRWGI